MVLRKRDNTLFLSFPFYIDHYLWINNKRKTSLNRQAKTAESITNHNITQLFGCILVVYSIEYKRAIVCVVYIVSCRSIGFGFCWCFVSNKSQANNSVAQRAQPHQTFWPGQSIFLLTLPLSMNELKIIWICRLTKKKIWFEMVQNGWRWIWADATISVFDHFYLSRVELQLNGKLFAVKIMWLLPQCNVKWMIICACICVRSPMKLM